MSNLAGFPLLAPLNSWREACFETEHDSQFSFSERLESWFGHKVLSLVSLPANVAAAGVGLLGMATSACTLGAFKVALFIATFGNVELTFSTGFNWFAERTVSSCAEIGITLFELTIDVLDVGLEVAQPLKWVSTALKMDYLSDLLKNVFTFMGNRLEEGVKVSLQDEPIPPKPPYEWLTPLAELDRQTHCCSCFYKDEQPLSAWVQHKALSMINIPANAAVAVAGGSLLIAGMAAFVAKSILYGATNLHIQAPTAIYYTRSLLASSAASTGRNLLEVGVDSGVLLYRLADVLHVTKAVVWVADRIAFIPKAVCT